MMLPAVTGTLLASLSLVNPVVGRALAAREDTSNGADNNVSDSTLHKAPPVRYGVLLPPAFALLDVFGPLEVFQALSRKTHLELALLGRTHDPVSTAPYSSDINPFNSSFFPAVVPTHSYADDPPLDVLIVPGGQVSLNPHLEPEIAYIQKVFPKLQYLITICTGSGIAAEAGVLDGHHATTNKAAWGLITPMGPKVKWVSPARWVEDGKIWTSSGETAGLDLAFAFIREKYPNGTAIAAETAGNLEHVMVMNWRDDLGFGAMYHVPPQNEFW